MLEIVEVEKTTRHVAFNEIKVSELSESGVLALPRTSCHTFSHGDRIVLRPVQPAEADGVKAPLACINPKERFGHHYRVAYEESYYAEYGPNARIEDPWLMVVLCEHGEISPWGGTTLAACTKNAGRIAKKTEGPAFTAVAQDGDDGANVLFDVECFDLVVYEDTRRAMRIVQIKQRRRNLLRNRKQLARYRKFGLPVDHVAGPRNAKRYLAHVRQHALPDTPIVMLSQTKGNNEGKGK